MRSLSARRAWIEICCGTAVIAFLSVALRKESVDRNNGDHGHMSGDEQSLSARRAWIEIFMRREMSLMRPVALRKESVDRNNFSASGHIISQSRSPQGERG